MNDTTVSLVKEPISIADLASYMLGREATTGADFAEVALPMFGGCQVCHATIAAHGAYPSTTGYLRCADDIEGVAYYSARTAHDEIFADVP